MIPLTIIMEGDIAWPDLNVDDILHTTKPIEVACPLPSDYDHELALMLWPFTNAKELSADKFAKVARKSFAAFTRDHHQDCMAAWKAYCGKRQSPAYRRNTAPPKSE